MGPFLPPSSRNWQLIYPNRTAPNCHRYENVLHFDCANKSFTKLTKFAGTIKAENVLR